MSEKAEIKGRSFFEFKKVDSGLLEAFFSGLIFLDRQVMFCHEQIEFISLRSGVFRMEGLQDGSGLMEVMESLGMELMIKQEVSHNFQSESIFDGKAIFLSELDGIEGKLVGFWE